MIQGSCHCGQVQVTLTAEPEKLVSCNCSICHRLGALWGHVPIENVSVAASEEATSVYIHGDRTLAFHTCRRCGCTTHWENLVPEDTSYMAVNFRMCSPATSARFDIKRFDGADTWEFFD